MPLTSTLPSHNNTRSAVYASPFGKLAVYLEMVQGNYPNGKPMAYSPAPNALMLTKYITPVLDYTNVLLQVMMCTHGQGGGWRMEAGNGAIYNVLGNASNLWRKETVLLCWREGTGVK